MVHYACMNDFSNGTLKLLSLFEEIFLLLKRGGTLVIDNISNDFHPAVIKYMVDLFQQETNENAQLVFTTYDVSILNNRQFRRDEVAFVDINQVRQSRLYTLADIKVRSDASFSKDYLLGKYGAIPMVREEQARDQSEAVSRKWRRCPPFTYPRQASRLTLSTLRKMFMATPGLTFSRFRISSLISWRLEE